MRINEIFERSTGNEYRYGGIFAISGRSPRTEYLIGTLILIAFGFLLSLLIHVLYSRCGRPIFCAYVFSPAYAFNVAFIFFLLAAMLCQRIRRFHDFGLPASAAILTIPILPLTIWAYFTWPEYSHLEGLLPRAPIPQESNIIRRMLLLILLIFTLVPFFIPANIHGTKYDDIKTYLAQHKKKNPKNHP